MRPKKLSLTVVKILYVNVWDGHTPMKEAVRRFLSDKAAVRRMIGDMESDAKLLPSLAPEYGQCIRELSHFIA
jgi:hypothetical protein